MNKRILMVDDRIIEWMKLNHDMSKYGIGVEWQGSLHFAKDLINHAPTDYFDLILIDYIGTTLPGYNIEKMICDVEKNIDRIIIISSDFQDIKQFQFIPKEKVLEFLKNFYQVGNEKSI